MHRMNHDDAKKNDPRMHTKYKKCILGYIFSLQNTEDEETFVVSVIAQIIKGQRESSFSDKGSWRWPP